jgi:hypothetical protein
MRQAGHRFSIPLKGRDRFPVYGARDDPDRDDEPAPGGAGSNARQPGVTPVSQLDSLALQKRDSSDRATRLACHVEWYRSGRLIRADFG